MNYGTSIDGPTSSAETACLKVSRYPESNIKRHDLQIICGNSQAEAIAAAIMDKERFDEE
jgi:hypothetical protein